MKLSRLLLATALLAGSATLADAARQVTFKWDNPGSVRLFDGNTELQIPADATEFPVSYEETTSIFLCPAEGYVVTDILKPSSSSTPTRQGCAGNIEYGQRTSFFCGESLNGKEINISTVKLVYDATLPVKVENGADCLEAYFSKSWKEGTQSFSYFGKISLKDGDNPVKYPSAYTSDLVFNKLKGSDAQSIYSVTRNGKPVGDTNKEYNQNSYLLTAITPEDKVVVRVFENEAPVTEYVDLTFDLKDPLQDCISTCFDMTRSTFREIENGKINIAKGSQLKINFKEDYTFTKLALNGEDITSSYNASNRSIILKVDKNSTFTAEGSVTVYGDVKFKVYIMNPAGLRLTKGSYSTGAPNPVLDTETGTAITETIQLPETVIVSKNGTETKFKGATMTPENTQVFTITVSEKNPELHFGPMPGYYVQAVWDSAMENVLPYASYDAANSTIYVVTEKIDLSGKVHVNLIGSEPVKFQPSQGLATMWDNHVEASFGLNEGEQDIKFDPFFHVPFTLRPAVEFDKFAAFTDGLQIVADDNGIYNPEFYVPGENDDKSVFTTLTIYSDKKKSAPVGSVSVSKDQFEIDVKYGAPQLLSPDKATFLEGTTITVTPKSLKDLNLTVGTEVVYGYDNGTLVNLLKDGSYSFAVAKNKLTKITATKETYDPSGVEEINAENGSDAVIYNLQGIAVGKDLDSLPAGIYIRNGKKIMKK